MASWIPNIAFIQDLVDRVRGVDANRPLHQLDQRTQYLYDTLQTISGGELLVAKNVTVDPSTVPGTPVYFDDVSNTFKPGLAAVSIAPGNNYGFATDASLIRGVVLVKHGGAAGDIALVGKIKNSIWGINWAPVIDTGTLVSGVHFLSSVAPGKITRSRSNLSVYIGSLNSAGDMILDPTVNGSLRDHLHYRFELNAVVVADTATEGWAPASEFALPAAGATHGYVIHQNPLLAAVFPPVPLDASHLEFQGRGVHKDAVVIDANGIWWKGATGPDVLTVDPDFAPPTYGRYYVLWLTRLNFGATFVSSLDPLDNAGTLPVTFEGTNGLPARSGALLAGIKQVLRVSPEVSEAAVALKELNGVLGKFGPVASRIFAGPGATVEGEFGDDAQGWYGHVTVSTGASSAINGEPVLVALDNAVEDLYGSLPVLAFPELRVSSVRCKVNVPTVLPGDRSMRLVLDIIGVTSGTVALNLSYVLVRAGAPISQTDIPLDPLNVSRVVNQFTRVESALIPVTAGDTVFYRVTQPDGGLATAIPILRMQYSIIRTP